MRTDKVTRIEVIDYTPNNTEKCGRVFVKWNKDLKVELSLQDDGRTLKVYIMKRR